MKKCTKILYPVATVAFGGVETFIRQTALFHDLTSVVPVYCFLRDGPLVQWLQANTPHEIRVCPFAIRLRNPISVIRAVLWLRQEIHRSSADLVHSSMAYAALLGALAAKLAGKPHVWFQHGPVGGWMDRLAGLLPARTVLYNSRYTLERQVSAMRGWKWLEKWLSPGLIQEVFPLGATPPPVVRERDFSEKIHIGMLSRFQKWKGIEVFIEAIGIIKKGSSPGQISATLWGAAIPGQESTLYATRIFEGCQRHSIRLLPPTQEPELAISSLDILVNCSIVPEPFGLTLVEGMNAGVIPIAPRSGGPLEIIDDGVTGLFFQPGNADDLAKKIIALTADPKKRSRISNQAKSISADRFSAEKSIRRLEIIYHRLLETKKEH